MHKIENTIPHMYIYIFKIETIPCCFPINIFKKVQHLADNKEAKSYRYSMKNYLGNF